MKRKPYLAAAILSLFLTGFSAAAVFGADEKIDSVSLTVVDAGDLTAGAAIGEVTVTSQDSRYYVDSARFLNDHEIWQKNERPKVRVELYASEYCRFTRTSKQYFSLSGFGAVFASASIMDNGFYMELDFYLDRVSGNGTVSQEDFALSWSGNTATWENHYGTEGCEVRLYRWNSSGSSSSVVTTKKTALDEYDFTSYMTSSGYYTFRVRPYDSGFDASQMWSSHSEKRYVDSYEAADNRDDDYGEGSSGDSYGGPGYEGSGSYGWGYEEDYLQSSYGGPGYGNSASPGSPGLNPAGQWINDQAGWWYRYSNGGWPFSSWQMINGKWYYFNSQGYLQTGWIWLENAWYYSFPDGSMATGWQKIGPHWYYLSNSGQMASGWTLINGGWYYLDPNSGAMWAGCFTPNGHYVNGEGVRLY